MVFCSIETVKDHVVKGGVNLLGFQYDWLTFFLIQCPIESLF